MATYHTFLLVFVLMYGVLCQIEQFISVLSCKQTGVTAEFFDTITLSCVQCSQNSSIQKRSDDGLTCECKPGYRYTKNFGGSKVTCEYCPIAVSDDGWECVNCTGSSVDTLTRKCATCPGDTARVLRLPNGNYSSGSKTVECQPCNSDTQPNSDASRCERCSTTISITNGSCSCPPNNVKKNGICILSQPTQSSWFSLPLVNKDIQSLYLLENLEADYYLCSVQLNVKACQSLANMCVLIMYRATPTPNACSLMLALPQLKPQIFVDDRADAFLLKDDISIQWTVDPIMTFPFIMGQFALDGSFEGYSTLEASFLHLCSAEAKVLNAAFKFGTYYQHSCSISPLTLWDQLKYPLKFYEIFLRYTDKTGNQEKEVLYRIPLKIQNYKDSQGKLVNTDQIRDWKLMRRFFLVDSLAATETSPQNGTSCATTGILNVRYAKSIHLYVELQPNQGDGLINVPYFEIEYSDINRQSACDNASVQFSFQVSYTMSQSSYVRSFQIATGVLCSFGLLYAGFRTYVWSRRAGRISIDFPTLANFIFYLCGSLSNCFFCIVFGIAFYFFIFYKRQNVVFLVHLEGTAYEEWLALFAAAFALKALALIHMIIMQCSVDLFLIDWERPKGSSAQGGGDAGKKTTKQCLHLADILCGERME